jgi:hypothetical protein
MITFNIYKDMQNILTNELNGTVKITENFEITDAPQLTQPGSEYIISISNLENVSKINQFNFDSLGVIDTRYINTFYRISRNGESWSEWLDLDKNVSNFPLIDSKELFFMEVKWVRKGTSEIGIIRILEYSISGILERNEEDGEEVVIVKPGENKIIKPPFVFKVFSFSDLEIISSDLNNVILKYRYSQDNSRSWSNWEILTKENISTAKISPIRFFQIEYNIENNSQSSVKIYDINLIGSFQNVSKDYFKTNLYGIRECCQSKLLGASDSLGAGCSTDDNKKGMMSDEEKSKLFNPYQQNSAINLLSQLSSDAEQVFGHKVIYFSTDPDKKGTDHTLHEYQLYNVVCEGEVKISIEGNNFPDTQIKMNQFDLDLFDVMEAHITKEQFKSIFGPQRRPAKEDFLYFCDLNRMFQVDHAQQFRNFNNSAVYYKLILKKYSQKANVQAGNQNIKDKISQLTQNSTIDELFGVEKAQDKQAVANKDQFAPLTKDPIRLDYIATINKELIENGTLIIAKSHYNLSSVNHSELAVKYKNLDSNLKISDNIGFVIWFNIQNYINNESLSFFNNYDNTNSLGWKSELTNDTITVKVNSNEYEFHLSGQQTSDVEKLYEDTWYCYVLNIDQRNRKIEQYIYKRNVDDESDASKLVSTILRLEYENIQDYIPAEYQLENINPMILGSDMKVTNIRLFLETLPKETHNKILNQYVIRDDSKYLIFADNANTRLYLPNHSF